MDSLIKSNGTMKNNTVTNISVPFDSLRTWKPKFRTRIELWTLDLMWDLTFDLLFRQSRDPVAPLVSMCFPASLFLAKLRLDVLTSSGPPAPGETESGWTLVPALPLSRPRRQQHACNTDGIWMGSVFSSHCKQTSCLFRARLCLFFPRELN